MTIFMNNFKRLFRKRLNLLFMFIVPIGLIIVTLVFNNGKTMVRLGIVDEDQTRLTQSLTQYMKDKVELVPIHKNEIQNRLIEAYVDYVIVIPAHFTEKILQQKDISVEGYSIQGTELVTPAKMNIQSVINTAKTIAKVSKKNEDTFYEGLQHYWNGSFSAEYQSVGKTEEKNGGAFTSLGFLVMSMLYLSTSASFLILEDKRNNTFHRIFASPLTLKKYMLQNIFSFFVLVLVQIAIILGIMSFIFDTDFNQSIINLFVVLAVFSLVCVSLGIAINGSAKGLRQAGIGATLINIPMCMLGGCFWPREIMPELLQKIGNFVPTTWVIEGMEKVLSGGSLKEVSLELVILLVFAIVFFLLGTWRKTDIAK